MSHEWNCRCPRCVADEAKYTGPDPRDDERDDAAKMKRLAGFLEAWGVRVSH